MGQTDIQFKDDLRKELIMLENFKKLAETNRVDELIEEIEKQIKRINASLQD